MTMKLNMTGHAARRSAMREAVNEAILAPISRTARRNEMRAAKKAVLAQRSQPVASRSKPQVAKEEGEQHVWHVKMTQPGAPVPWENFVVATSPEFVKRAMTDRYARHLEQGERDVLELRMEQLDDGRFDGPFRVVTGPEVEGPFDSLLEATNRADDIFDIEDYDKGSCVLDSKGREVLRLSLTVHDTGVVRYRPGYYD